MPFPVPSDPADDIDPLLYRGTSPVLGAKVEVREAGALPTDFPATAGPAPAPPGRPPVGPSLPGQPALGPPPTFEWSWSGADLPTPPTPPGLPGPYTPPPSGASWWEYALGGAQKAATIWKDIRTAMGTPEVLGTTQIGAAEGAPMRIGGADIPEGPGAAPETVTSPGLGFNAPTGLAAAQIGTGALGLASGEPSQQAAGAANVVGGGLSAAALAGLLPAAFTPIGPAIAGALATWELGALIGGAIAGDPGPAWLGNPNYTGAFRPVPGQANAGVDPSTGAILWYTGGGSYAFPSQTALGQQAGMTTQSADFAPPEAFVQWQIFPQGPLLQNPAYRAVVPQILQSLGPQYAGGSLNQFPAEIQALPEFQTWLQSQQTPPPPPGSELLSGGAAIPAPTTGAVADPSQLITPDLSLGPGWFDVGGTPTFLPTDPNLPAGAYRLPGGGDVYWPDYTGGGGGRD